MTLTQKTRRKCYFHNKWVGILRSKNCLEKAPENVECFASKYRGGSHELNEDHEFPVNRELNVASQ